MKKILKKIVMFSLIAMIGVSSMYIGTNTKAVVTSQAKMSWTTQANSVKIVVKPTSSDFSKMGYSKIRLMKKKSTWKNFEVFATSTSKTGDTFVDKSVESGCCYTYRVMGCKKSTKKWVYLNTGTSGYFIKQPTITGVSNIKKSGATVKWSNASCNFYEYKVVKVSTGKVVKHALVSGKSVTTISITGLSKNTKYKVRVQGLQYNDNTGAYDESVWSSWKTFTTEKK
ncbi:fibronectin type III domain-containing protein [Eubacterium oxidoreducens]|uniref:Fibronectin type III domain-containing protein n=1 Tax=Eubacterium oxidoreducens TaxID=1732 RepID=A0A1G6B2Z1_EUBOX|nr:fibronectin type III domain-containing protein [Eubacterium oxidoreducens]SDB14955.1 Fibronectin type III domain-containing protein [Eubacterium oxidoreducens]